MAINKEAIDRFLNKGLPWIPQFKGASQQQLENWIFDCTGRHFRPLVPCRQIQLEGVAAALYLRKALLFYEPRTGKTKIALDFAEHLRRTGQWRGKGLVIAHAPIGLDVWAAEAAKMSTLLTTCVRSGPDARDEFCNALEDKSDLIIIAWSTLQTLFSEKRPNRKGVLKLYPDVKTLRYVAEAFDLSIIDEIHLCSHWTSLRFEIGACLVENARFRLGLTGTPFDRNPLDVWPQAFLVDGGAALASSPRFFAEAFGTEEVRAYAAKPITVFNKNHLNKLRDKLATISISGKLSEIHDINILRGHVQLRMWGEQRRAYNECVDKAVKLSSGQTVEIASTYMRMRQISAGFLPFVGDYKDQHIHFFKENPKREWFTAFLEEMPDDYPLVVFHEFQQTGLWLQEVATTAKRSFAALNGFQKTKDEWKRFVTGETNLLIANHQSGSMAIDLRRAEYVCFIESPSSHKQRTQAEARPMGRGSKPFVIDDVTCSPVDRRVLALVQEGKELAGEVLAMRESMREHV